MPISGLSHKLFSKVFILLVVLVGLAVNVFLVISVSLKTNTKAATNVDIFFTPETVGIPPDTVFRFMIDPKSQPVSFLQTAIKFDQNVLQLSASPVLGDSGLYSFQQLTSLEEANRTGRVDVILLQQPRTTAPTDTFVVFNLPITFLQSTPPTTSYITVVDEDTHIIHQNTTELPFSVKYATVKVKEGRTENISGQQGNCPEGSIDTAIGCIPISDNQKLAEFFLRWGLGIAGGLALILIVFSGYQITTTEGDPRKLQAAKELLTAALTGLILVVLSAYILKLIGVDILQLPGFN